jgi:hypothetical protein
MTMIKQGDDVYHGDKNGKNDVGCDNMDIVE